MEPVTHLVCAFTLFCGMGGDCVDHPDRPLEVNLRFNTQALFAEFWIGAAPTVPFPAVLSAPGEIGFSRHLRFFVSGDLSGTYLVSLDPNTFAATLTTHLPWAEGPTDGHLNAQSSHTTCTLAQNEN